MIHKAKLFLILLCAASVSAGPSPAKMPVDIELVLAVDTSLSMDYDELKLQREGYAQALEHPAVTSALTAGALGRVALMVFEWGGPGSERVLIDWTLIESHEDAVAVAAQLRNKSIQGLRGTSISGAMIAASVWIDSNDYEGRRKVLDISGDGPNNRGRPVNMVRDELAARGIEINGLPFMFKQPDGTYSIPDLDLYYQDCVISGDSAFVIPIFEIERLVVSIRQKLVLEVSGKRPPARPRLRKASAFDCLIGERLQRQRQQIWGQP